MDTALAYRICSNAHIFLELVAVSEADIIPMELLFKQQEKQHSHIEENDPFVGKYIYNDLEQHLKLRFTEETVCT